MNWVGNTIYEWLEELCNEVFSFLFQFINGLFENGEALIKATEIQTASVVTRDIATIIVSIVILYNVLSIYIFETNGDSEQDPLQQLVNASIAVALIQSSAYLFNWALELGSLFAGEIADVELNLGTAETFWDVIETKIGETMTLSMWVVILVVFVIGMICFLIMAFIRGGELALMKVLLPIFCCDLLTSSKERFNAFITSFCITTFSYGIQLLCFRLSMNQFVNVSEIYHIPMAYVWLYLAIRAPKWLEKYAYSSGIGGMARTGASSAGQVVMMSLVRKAA